MMQVLTTSGLYMNGSAERILTRLAELSEEGIPIHAASEGRYFLAEDERDDRCLTRSIEEILTMSAMEFLSDMEAAGHLLISQTTEVRQ